jgi:hypothetical protein
VWGVNSVCSFVCCVSFDRYVILCDVCFLCVVGNACYHSVENVLSSRLLSKNIKIRIYKTIILPVALYGCETWSLTLREEHRLRVFENRLLRRIFGPRRDEVTGDCIMRSFITCTPRQT